MAASTVDSLSSSPAFSISYTNMTLLVPAPPPLDEPLPNVFRLAWSLASCSRRHPPLRALDGISGAFPAARSCAVLAAPGAGASLLLRVLGARALPSAGRVLYNGEDATALLSLGVDVKRLVALCGEGDADLEALLTVEESFALVAHAAEGGLAAATDGFDATAANDAASLAGAPLSPAACMRVLGLTEAHATRVGNAQFRGVSGGQKRRVSLGEAMLQGGRCVLLDKPTTGLDAVTAAAVCGWLSRWARASRGVVIAVLQQPSPALLALFDDVVVLADGRELYHGPVGGLDAYLCALGFARPPGLTCCELASEISVDPARAAGLCAAGGAAWRPQQPRQQSTGEGDRANPAAAAPTQFQLALSAPPSEAIAELAAVWRGSAAFAALSPSLAPEGASLLQPCVRERTAAVDAAAAAGVGAHAPALPEPPTSLATSAVRARYGPSCALSLWQQFTLLLPVRVKLLRRNPVLILSRVVNALLMGVILATLFSNAGQNSFAARFGLALFGAVFIGFTNAAEQSMFAAARPVIYRHAAARYYTPLVSMVALIAVSIPVAAIVDFTFASIVYWSTGWTPSFSKMLVFFFTLFLLDLTMAGYLRTMAAAFRTLELANVVGIAAVSVFLLCSGFFVLRSQQPPWLAWLRFGDPYYWTIVAITCNEFLSARYSAPLSGSPPGSPSAGQTYSDAYDFPHSASALWGGVAFLAGAWLLFSTTTIVFLTFLRYDAPPGTRRRPQMLPGAPLAPASLAVDVPAAEHVVAVPRVHLAARGVTFSVPILRGRRTSQRLLLRGVTAVARPGTLTALIGATGAGKTTLLDVLACRKNASEGTVGGSICVSAAGEVAVASRDVMGHVSVYAQQTDCHSFSTTVREALAFSHALRATPTSAAAAHAAVAQLLRVLELDALAERLVDSLSHGELKVLTLGVELAAASAAVFFADEPTSNLDARSAAIVMRVLTRVSATGRTVICTVHQPSVEIMSHFTHLILLAPGGHTAFSGPMGSDFGVLVAYLSSLPNVPPLQVGEDCNVATWVLEALLCDPGAPPAADAEEGGRPCLDSVVPGGQASAADDEEQYRAGAHFAAWWGRSQLAAETAALAAAIARGGGGGNASSASQQASAQGTAVEASAQGTAAFADGSATAAGGAAGGSQVQREAEQRSPLRSNTSRSPATQLRVLVERGTRDHWRSASTVLAVFVTNALLGLLVGLLLINNDRFSFAGTVSTLGYGLAGASFAAIVFMQTGLTTQFQRKPAFLRERAARFYGAGVYAMATTIVSLPYVVCAGILFVSISYFLAKLLPRFDTFAFMCLCATIFGAYFSAIAVAWVAIAPSLPVAQIFGGLSISLTMLMGGVFIQEKLIPAFWKGLYYAVPSSHLVRAIGISQFFCQGATCPSIAVVSGGASSTIPQYAFVESYLGIESSVRFAWAEVAWAALAVLIVTLIGAVAMKVGSG